MLGDVRDAEVLRYLGRHVGAKDVGAEALSSARADFLSSARPRVYFREFAAEKAADGILLCGSGVLLRGAAIGQLLFGCDSALLVAGTLGAPLDLAIERAQLRSMHRGVLLDAFGSAGIEQAMDDWQEETAERYGQRGLFLTRRFSPGYADLPLDTQRSLLAALEANKTLGLYLTESLMLNPLKSVTAIVGVTKREPARCNSRCATCSMGGRCAFGKDVEV